jgi:hypothetical protein
MMKRALIAAGVTAVAAASLVSANDSTAEMTAGGLVLRNSRNIDLLEEDLFVSAEQVRVSYVFKNQARRDERVTVAFPMPDRDLTIEGESDVGFVRNFATSVEGRPVQTQVERRAVLGSVDHSALLIRLRMPIAPPTTWEENRIDPVRAAWNRLGSADRGRLKDLRLIHEDADGLQPLWTVKETHFWTQVFPAGRELRIQHRYVPGTGGSVGALLIDPDIRKMPEGRAQMREYCVDQTFLKAIDRMRREAGENGSPSELRFGYILRTGANWRSPIRNFRLVVDKGDPRNIVSFCAKGVRRISPTRFEVRRSNWRPSDDLRVLVVRPFTSN